MPRTIKAKFTIIFTIVLVLTVGIFSSLLYGMMHMEQEPMRKGRQIEIFRMIKDNPGRFPNIADSDQELIDMISDYIEEEERSHYNELIFKLLIPTVMISAAIAYLTAYFLVSPIEDMKLDVEALGDGDFSKRLPDRHAPKEVQYLRESFNGLLDNVESAFDSQEEFIQDAAHELRTPLASMKAHLELLETDPKKTKEEYEESIAVLTRMSEKLIKLSEDLLYLDRRKVMEMSEFGMSELLEEVVEMMNSYFEKEGVNVVADFQYKKKIRGDQMILARALENVLENSVKYGAKKISIRSYWDTNREMVCIKIKDDGVGIEKDDLDHIFDRFYRGSNEAEIDGTGLGLAIVKKIILDHAGVIEVKSTPDVGTTVKIFLPGQK